MLCYNLLQEVLCMNKLGRKVVPLLLCCIFVLSACSSGAPTGTGTSGPSSGTNTAPKIKPTSVAGRSLGANEIPLLLRYNSGSQERLVKIAFNTENGEIIFDDTDALTFDNTSIKEITDYDVPQYPPTYYIDKDWIGEGLYSDFWVSLAQHKVSNTAVYWDGSNKITLFTTEDPNSIEGNGLSADVVKLEKPPLCSQFINTTNCFATKSALYTFGHRYDTSAEYGGNSPTHLFDVTTIYKVSSSGMETATVDGTIIGIGELDGNVYALSSVARKVDSNLSQYLVLYILKPDGTISQQTVKNSEFGGNYYGNDFREQSWATFVNGYFYIDYAKINAVSSTPEYIKVPSLEEGMKTVSSVADFLHITVNKYPSPIYYQYKDYLLAVGQTFGDDEYTIAAFKDEKLVGFIIITPLNGSIVDQLKNETAKTSRLITHDATGKQLNTYIITPPAQVVIPQSQ